MSEFSMPAGLTGWRQLNCISGDAAFTNALCRAAQQGIWFTQAQQDIMRLACMAAAAQGMRQLAQLDSGVDEMLAAIRSDTAAAMKGGGDGR